MTWNNDSTGNPNPQNTPTPWRPVAPSQAGPATTPQSPFPPAHAQRVAPASIAPRYQVPASPANIAALQQGYEVTTPVSAQIVAEVAQYRPQQALAPMTASMPAAFPSIPADGAMVDASFYIEPWTQVLVYAGYAALAFFALAITIGTMGLALIAFGGLAILGYFLRRQAYSMIRGSGIAVGPQQLPEIHRAVQIFSQRLGLAQVPEVYLVEANVMNAAVVKLGKSSVLLITDDMIEAALRTSNVESLSFVLAHELAHVALGHTGFLRGLLRANIYLSRWDEYSADGVAMALTSPDSAIRGLILLTSGPGLLRYINPQALQEQVRVVWNDKNALRSERKFTHPLPLRRMGRIYQRIGA